MKKIYTYGGLGLCGLLVSFSGIFMITLAENPHTSELAFVENSASGIGSVVPASCESGDAHFGVCLPPSITSVTISGNPVVPNGSAQYTITSNAYASDGAGVISDNFVLINYNGGAGPYRGYLGWHNGPTGFYSWGDNYKNAPIACTGGGYAAIFGGGAGMEYLNIHGCTVSNSGQTQSVSFVVSFNTNFTTPLSSNSLWGFAYDNNYPWSAGWIQGNSFSVNPAPALGSATINTSPVIANDSTQYTITAVANDESGGTDIRDQMVLINNAGTNVGTYRGYLAWSHDTSFPFFGGDSANYKNGTWVGCTGGGSATIFDGAAGGGFGYQYLDIVACTTSVAGNQRTTTFTVTFDTTFATPTTNNNLSMYAQDTGGSQVGWGEGNYFSVNVAPAACGDGLDNDGDGKTDYPADNLGCSSSSDTNETDPASVIFSVCDGDGTDCVASGNTKDVLIGSSLRIDWDSSNATICSATSGNGFSTGNAPDGTDPATALGTVGTQQYTIACSNGGPPEITRSVTLNTLAGTSTLTANPRIVNQGTSATLTWNLAGQTGCTLTGGGAPLPLNQTQLETDADSSISLTVDARTTYVLSCTSSGDSVPVTVEIVPIGFET